MKAVWPDAVVEEGNLAHNVAALRKARASGEVRSDHVETVPGQGYRLVGRIMMLRDLAQSAPVSGSAAGAADVLPPGTRLARAARARFAETAID
jgi:DNA-binding winged helix-turn-helix (wHTH) protein